MLSSFRGRLNALQAAVDAEIDRRKPCLLSVSLNNGRIVNASPAEAIDLIWSSELGEIRSIETDRPEYAELAGALNAVFGGPNKT